MQEQHIGRYDPTSNTEINYNKLVDQLNYTINILITEHNELKKQVEQGGA